MFYILKKKKTYPAYVSKHNLSREKQVISLMILNGEGWYYIAVKQLPALLKEITPKNHSDLYFSNCLHSFRTANRLKSHKIKIM